MDFNWLAKRKEVVMEDCFVFPYESQGKPLLILCPGVGKERWFDNDLRDLENKNLVVSKGLGSCFTPWVPDSVDQSYLPGFRGGGTIFFFKSELPKGHTEIILSTCSETRSCLILHSTFKANILREFPRHSKISEEMCLLSL